MLGGYQMRRGQAQFAAAHLGVCRIMQAPGIGPPAELISTMDTKVEKYFTQRPTLRQQFLMHRLGVPQLAVPVRIALIIRQNPI